MGNSATLKVFETTKRDDVDVEVAVCDPGGGAEVECDYYRPAGEDSKPLVGDTVALVELTQTGQFALVGTVDPKLVSTTEPGGKRIYSRSSAGAEVATVFLKNTGDIEMSNGAGSIVLGADGTVIINGLKISASGELTVPAPATFNAPVSITGAFDVTGAVDLTGLVTITGVSTGTDFRTTTGTGLLTHTHLTTVPGVPTGPPVG